MTAATAAATTWRARTMGTLLEVRCEDQRVAGRLRALLDHLPAEDGLPLRKRARIDVVRRGDGWALIDEHDAPLAAAATCGRLVDLLQWQINTVVIEALHRSSTGLHAAAASVDGRAVVLPAASGAGKSTVVTGLVAAGWHYVSDEACEIGPDLAVHGFGKAITIDPGSQPLFPALRPDPDDAASWYVPPARVSGGAWAPAAAEAHHVVLPRWDPGSRVELMRLAPGQAVMALAPCTFYFNSDGARHLRALASLVRRVPVWRLTYPDLASAVAAVEDVCGRSGDRCRAGGTTP